MLRPDGTICFVDELLDVVASFLQEYEATRGPLESELERGLVVSYVLGTMRGDLDAVWEGLGAAPVFGSLHPRAVYDECARGDDAAHERRRQAIVQALADRGWITPAGDDPDD